MSAYTVAVMNFNGREILGPTLDALRELPAEDDAHVMIVDNGSTDGSPDWVRDAYPEFPLHLVADDGSIATARNWALTHAPTRYVLLLDNDLIVDPACPAKLAAVLAARPEALACTPRMLYVETPEVIHNDVGRFHYLGVSGRSERGRTVAEVPPRDVPQPTVPGGIAMVDRQRLERVGLFDDAYGIGWGCDAELYMRGAIAGLESLHLSSALTYHPIPAHGYGRAEAQIYNRYRIILTMYAGRTMLLLAPVLLPFEIVLTALFVVKGLTGVQLKCIGRVLRELGELRSVRREIQATRRGRDTRYLTADGFSGGGPLARSRPVAWASGAVESVLRAYWWLVRRWI